MYYLKQYNETLLTFEMEMDLSLKITNINIISKNKDIFPIQLQKYICPKTIEEFLNQRIVPKNRAFVNKLLEAQGLNIHNIKGIIDISKGLSLNDCYWITQDENLNFENYNLYDNNFSEILSLIAFTGYTSKIKGISTSPEFTTDGVLPKAWRRIDNNVFLYKGSTKGLGFSNSGFEPYSEYYSSQIASKMNLNSVPYDLKEWKGNLCSVCPLFTSKKYSYVPIWLASNKDNIEDIYYWCKDKGFEKDFSNLILFDSLILNEDRHLANFGVLRDNTTGKFVSLAPIFDNGEGLLAKGDIKAFKNKEMFNSYIQREDVNTSNYGVDYKKLVSAFCDKNQIALLRKLVNFTFLKHDLYNLQENRLNLLEEFIQKRSRELINVITDAINKKQEIELEETKDDEEWEP